ncbi:hypothetical protein BJV74DRAFT_798626 [Russula compacta]|nr:hypothetical protein BJV74DRAFT_798626 [Russula compacta]
MSKKEHQVHQNTLNSIAEDEMNQATTSTISPSSSFVIDGRLKDTKQTSNLIYYFYKALQSALHGIDTEEGDKFYQCYHGRRKIMEKMRNNLNGLIGNLRTCLPDMFKFYSYLKDHALHQQEKVAEPWSQEMFEELLTKWIVTSNQPFKKVESSDLADLLNYINQFPTLLKIPSCFTFIMKMNAKGV